MRATSAVVLAIDRLGAGWLGPYGNTWLDTPNFNRLAAQSRLYETALADSPQRDGACRAYWTGRHLMERSENPSPSLPQLATTAGGTAMFVTDDAELARHAHAAGFAERRVVPTPANASCVENLEQTGLFAFLDTAIAVLRDATRPGLVWLHSRGMSGPWDAPLALRYQFADEEDPQPPDFAEPPQLRLDERFDPDTLLGFVQAYAGQVALADLCLGMLLDALDEHPLGRETLLVVTSPRGYPLGEHRRVGACDDALYGELLHVPLFIRFPKGDDALARCQRIVQPHDVFSLIAETCGWGREIGKPSGAATDAWQDDQLARRGVACAVGPAQRAIRTSAWFLRESHLAGSVHHELFAKPDDRWEANEISSRCGEALELLAAELNRLEAAARAGRLAEAAPLAELLYDIWR